MASTQRRSRLPISNRSSISSRLWNGFSARNRKPESRCSRKGRRRSHSSRGDFAGAAARAGAEGELRSAAFTELNSLASGMAVLVPVLIGLSIFGGFGWRPGLVLAPILAVPVLAVWSRGLEIPEPRRVATSVRGSLTPAYWAYWATLVLVVSVEFCMIYWTTAFFRTVFGLDPALAAGALTLFLLGMLVGSAAGGRIALRWPPTS